MGRRSSVATMAASKAFAVSVSPESRSRDDALRSPAIADSNAGCRLTEARVSDTDVRIMICCWRRATLPKQRHRRCGFVARELSWSIRGRAEWKLLVHQRLRLLRGRRLDPAPNRRP